MPSAAIARALHGRFGCYDPLAKAGVESEWPLCDIDGMRRWLEVSLEVPPAARDAIDAIGAWLVTRGAPGIIEEDLGESVRLRAHFEEGQAAREIGRASCRERV